jgi:hypothetical protein
MHRPPENRLADNGIRPGGGFGERRAHQRSLRLPRKSESQLGETGPQILPGQPKRLRSPGRGWFRHPEVETGLSLARHGPKELGSW